MRVHHLSPLRLPSPLLPSLPSSSLPLLPLSAVAFVLRIPSFRCVVYRRCFRFGAPNHPPLASALASPSPSCLRAQLPECFCETDVAPRHGALLAVAEITRALAAIPAGSGGGVGEERAAELRTVLPELEKRRLYRGRGCEHVRIAACRLAECLAMVGPPGTTASWPRTPHHYDFRLHSPHVDITLVLPLRALNTLSYPEGLACVASELRSVSLARLGYISRIAQFTTSLPRYCLSLVLRLSDSLISPRWLHTHKIGLLTSGAHMLSLPCRVEAT